MLIKAKNAEHLGLRFSISFILMNNELGDKCRTILYINIQKKLNI